MENENRLSTFNYNDFYNYVSKYFVGNNVIKLIYVGINAARRSNTIPAFLLRGPPGAGKTMITKIVADYFNANYVFIQATLNTTEDELIYKYVPSENTKSGVRILYGPLPEALIKSREKMTVLVIDEFDKTRPSADALLLDYLQNARVSFRIDDKEDVITGNKDNLIVFITSNDNREFSEPLLRRVITIDFKLPDPRQVEELLRKYFDDEKIIKLLTTIYRAGIIANLTKPITIQELVQLGHALQVLPDVDFNELLLSFVVKNVDDLQALKDAIQNLDNYEPQQKQVKLPDLGTTLVEKINTNTEQQQKNINTEQQTTTAQHVLSNIKLPVDKIVKNIDNVDKISSTVEVSFNTKIDEKTFYEYSEIIKQFKLEPGERPDVLDKFKVIYDDTLRMITEKPLTLKELRVMTNTIKTFEAYIEDYVYITPKELIELIKKRYDELQITYYTKDVIIAQHKEGDKTRTVVRLERIRGDLYKIKLYVDYDRSNSTSIGDKQRDLIAELEGAYQLHNVYNTLITNLVRDDNIFKEGEITTSRIFKVLTKLVTDAKDIIHYGKTIIKDYLSYADVYYRYNYSNEISIRTIERIEDDGNIKLQIDVFVIYVKVNDRNQQREISITNEVKEIIKKYAGEYDLIDGLIKFEQLVKELKQYGNKIIREANLQ